MKGLVPKGSRIIRTRSEGAFLKTLPKATHAITWHFKKEWFAKAPKLKVLATPAAGQEFVPTKGPKGVKIHFGHYHGRIMSESVLGFMLCWAKGFFAVRQAPQGCRDWPRTWLSGRCTDVAGTRAVIVGYGNVGRAIGAKLESQGVKVEGFSRKNIDNLANSAKNADWFIMALPSTTGTDNLLDAKLLARLPKKCVVINVGRGNSVDEKALLKSLRQGKIAGAYLDVCKHEPSGTGGDRPRKIQAGVHFLGSVPNLPENLVLMPHASAFSPRYLIHCFEELKDDGCL